SIYLSIYNYLLLGWWECRNSREKLKEVTKKSKEKAEEPEKDLEHKGTQTPVPSPDEPSAARKGPALDLAGVGARCKGSRHDEIIHRQKDALAELRQRIRMLEKACPLDRASEPLIVVKKSPVEKRERKTEKEEGMGEMTATEANKLQRSTSSVDPNVTIERTSKLEMADALDLSENMYFAAIQDLARLVDVKELVGMQTVMYLPHDERERVKTLRQKDLRLLSEKVTQLKSRLERKESLLKEYEKDLGKLRANKETLQACQSEIAKLGDRVYQESEEKALLKEALERTKLQLTQERRLNRALKHHKNHLEEKRNRISPCHSCTQKFRDGKFLQAASPKNPFPGARKMIEKPAEPCEKRAQRTGST
ncbi:forkhead-associated domain-containing protein 1-like, partial [Sceloporus undulatus]|uniref:forkhead-associated domain-containing protein 1-like n=1 Tax=Sceloporus undulatus TaxID=8520 RepID=UPI001C4C9AC6